jgi:molybdopterin converting factor small subunit
MPDCVMSVTIDPTPATRDPNFSVTATVIEARRRLACMSDPTVDVHLFAAARAAVGASQLSVPAATLSEILDRIEAAYPAFAGVRPRCSVLVDGTAVHDDVAVAAGSRVDVLPPFAGG